MNIKANPAVVQFKDYISGWLDSSVREFLEVFPLDSASTAYVLVTCLDSNLAPKDLVQNDAKLQRELVESWEVGDGVLFPSRLLKRPAVRNELFFGFDEIWFFPTHDIQPKPQSARIVGPGRVDQTRLDALGMWMKTENCTLALGDGDGLNFIVKARGMAKYLLALSMSQRPSELQSRHVIVQDEN